MKIKPVEDAVVPQYPDKYNEEVKHALRTAKPNRWRGSSLAAIGLSAAVALSLSGCYTTAGDPIQSPTVPEEIEEFVVLGDVPVPTMPMTTPVDYYVTDGEPGQSPTSIEEIEEFITMGVPMLAPVLPYGTPVPLFEHGEGTGAIGCVSIAAPVFLSEEEAYAILSSAFADAGLILSQDTRPLENVNLPITDIYESGEVTRRYETVQESIRSDGLLDYELPVIFVSTKDVAAWHKDTGMMSSVISYHVKKTAQTLAENNPYLAVFYDPIASLDDDTRNALVREEGESDESYDARRSAALRGESERLLRLQAEAFVAWLEDGGYR